MKYIAIVLFFLVNTYAAASDVFYGINDASTQVGQRFYCGLLACGIVKTQLGITEVTLGANAVVLTDINNGGYIVGAANNAAGPQFAISCNGNGCGAIPAWLLNYPYSSVAWRINDLGQVLITKNKYTYTWPRRLISSQCLLTNGVCVDLPPVSPGGISATVRYALNNLGDTGGTWYNADQSKGFGFIQSSSGAVTLISYPGSLKTVVTGLNDAGHASGYACLTMTRDYQVAGATCITMVGFKYIDGVFETVPNNFPQDLNNLDETAGP